MDTAPKAVRTDKDILEQARERMASCVTEYDDLRKQQRDDLNFSTLEQWPTDIRNARENDPNGARPCLTIDQINQYVVQVVNDMRQNKPAVKVRPTDDDADEDTAEVFSGLIRQIEDQSVAQVAYMTAGESAVRVGEGYFRFSTEYEDERSFNQIIRVQRVTDMFSCYLGPHEMPDGSDAEYGFIFEDLTEADFRRKYPKAKYQATDFEMLHEYRDQWGDEKTIRVAEYFYFDYTPATIVFLADGTSVLESEYDESMEAVDSRETQLRSTKWCKLTGIEILKKADWAGKYIPIVKVTGKEAWVKGKRNCWGLVRPAKDSLRMYNYWASTITEKIALSPKSPFIGAKGQFEGLEERWSQANRVNYAYLEYNAVSVDGLSVPPPQRQQPAPMEVAMIEQLKVIREDVQSSLGMFRASLGKEQPNQSGKAILALTRESDTGTFHFADNLSLAIAHGGRILVDLIPKIYDTAHVRKILGEDGKMMSAQLDPDQPTAAMDVDTDEGIKSIYNLNVGTYDVTCTTGPSYNTKRMEAATMFTELAMSAKDPGLAAVANYLAMKNADFNGAEQAADIMEKMLPPGLIQQEGQPEIPPEVIQHIQQMEQAGNQLVQENQELKSGQQEAMAKVEASKQAAEQKAIADHDIKMRQLELDRQVQEAELRLQKEKQDAEIALKTEMARVDTVLADRALENEKRIKSETLAFDQECRAKDEDAKRKEESEAKREQAEDKALPEFLKALEKITQTFADAMSKPREINLGNIKRDESGRIQGATARTH